MRLSSISREKECVRDRERERERERERKIKNDIEKDKVTMCLN